MRAWSTCSHDVGIPSDLHRSGSLRETHNPRAEDLAHRAFTLTGPLRCPALGAPVPFPAEALPHWARQHGSKQESADNTGDDKREERGHTAVVQKAD